MIKLLGLLQPITFAFLLAIIPASASAQQRSIGGTVKTIVGKVMPAVTVILSDSNAKVVAFGNTNSGGRFVLQLPDTARREFLWVEVNRLGYRPIRQSLKTGKEIYDLVLEEASIALKEVKIKPRPIIKATKDTLSYDVASFSRTEDRSIGDVIRHLPGMDVADDGRISFNGKTISNLYIHGDDLMAGRYGLATKTITKEMIQSIDVLKNFEPIKVLKDKSQTDNVAINLVLKDENSLKLTGQVMPGLGLPEQFDAQANTMIFNKKFKMLNSLQGNNSGIDYRDDFKQYNATEFMSDAENNRPKPLLSIGTAGNPDIPRKNYYLNRSAVLNTNNLYNMPSGIQLKSNIQLFTDRNDVNYYSQTDTYLDPDDTIRYVEQQNSRIRSYLLNASLSALVNKSTHYLANTLRMNLSSTDYVSRMNFNGNAFNQQLPERVYDFSNELNWIPALKKQGIINMSWYLNYYSNSQNLNVDSGVHREILNNNLVYARVGQYARLPSYFSNASISYRPAVGLIRQSYQLGLLNENQQINTALNLTQQGGEVNVYTGDAGNQLRWQRDKFYLNTSYFLKKAHWETSLSMPVSWQLIRYEQEEYELNRLKSQLFFAPAMSFKLFIGAEDFIDARYTYNNNAGNIASVYRGLVLTNYRSLRANISDLQQQFNSAASMFYTFQRSIIMLFINGGISYGKVKADAILSSTYTNGVQRTILLPYQNGQSTLSANVGINKFIFALGTTLSIKAFWNRNLYSQLVNGEMLAFINSAWQGNLGIDSKIFGKVTFKYNSNATWSNSRQSNRSNLAAGSGSRIFRADQNITLGYTPINTLFINVSGRTIYNKQQAISENQVLFMDAGIRYKISKWRTDLQFDLTNLFGVNQYQTIYLSGNQLTINNYDIRGRMGVFRATFSL